MKQSLYGYSLAKLEELVLSLDIKNIMLSKFYVGFIKVK